MKEEQGRERGGGRDKIWWKKGGLEEGILPFDSFFIKTPDRKEREEACQLLRILATKQKKKSKFLF
jgi:hypothetical protein